MRENDELLHIETSRGVVDATTSHPFYVVGKGWVAAGDLREPSAGVAAAALLLQGTVAVGQPHVQ